MAAVQNKELMQRIFDGLGRGDGKLFRDSLADDFRWVVTGKTKWSGTYSGKRNVFDQLLKPLYSLFADQYITTASRIVADEDVVVVECQGRVTLKTGKPYNNNYCWVCRLAGGKILELTEYMDTELANSVL
jgi:ketosteroid isomerase-like protein